VTFLVDRRPRNKFQFAAVGQLIEHGKLTTVVKHPNRASGDVLAQSQDGRQSRHLRVMGTELRQG
jgi:hypothetical protein